MVLGRIPNANYTFEGNPNRIGFFQINLYDLKALSNLKQQSTNCGDNLKKFDILFGAEDCNGLTEKQRKLALKIIYKYRKQFELAGIPVGKALEEPKWKSPEREYEELALSAKLSDDEKTFQISFPFNANIVPELRRFWHENIIDVAWNQEEKYWGIENSNTGINIVKRIKEELPTLDTTNIDHILDTFVDYTTRTVISWSSDIGLYEKIESNNLVVNQIISSNLTDLQKISKLAYLDYSFDVSVEQYLIEKYGLDNIRIKILCTHNSVIDLAKFGKTPAIAIKSFHEFVYSLKLGITVEHFDMQKHYLQPSRTFWKSLNEPSGKMLLYPDANHGNYFDDFIYGNQLLAKENKWNSDKIQDFGVCLLTKGIYNSNIINTMDAFNLYISTYIQYNNQNKMTYYKSLAVEQTIKLEKIINVNDFTETQD